jgi:hypothetical protein
MVDRRRSPAMHLKIGERQPYCRLHAESECDMALTPPNGTRAAPATVSDELKVHRRDHLGGVVREYVQAA